MAAASAETLTGGAVKTVKGVYITRQTSTATCMQLAFRAGVLTVEPKGIRRRPNNRTTSGTVHVQGATRDMHVRPTCCTDSGRQSDRQIRQTSVMITRALRQFAPCALFRKQECCS